MRLQADSVGAGMMRRPSINARSVAFGQQVLAMSPRRPARGNNIPKRSFALRPRYEAAGDHGDHFMERLGQQERLNTKRSIKIYGHPTSVSLEDAFWNALKEIAATREVSVSDLIATLNKERQHANLSSVLRLFVLDHYRAQVDDRKLAERPVNEKGRPADGAALHP
jgi:predicted DNA-binding ribbon-helix-helix protein